jgi:hypothetical protein
MAYNGWMIPDAQRDWLMSVFEPRYPNHKATHVTQQIDCGKEFPHDAEIIVVGYTHDPKGIEAFVVSVDGVIHRPDGSIYHLTYSVDEGRASKESNDAIRECGFERIPPIPVETRAFYCAGDAPYITTPLTGLP